MSKIYLFLRFICSSGKTLILGLFFASLILASHAQTKLNAGFPYGPVGSYDTDQYFDPGNSKTSGNNSIVIPGGITGPLTDEEIYTSSRVSLVFNGDFDYNIPVGCGKYDITLHFAEIYFGAPDGLACAPCTGLRVFDIDVEDGQASTTNYDVVAAAGGPVTATSLTYTNINVNDGFLTLLFTGVVENPFVSGIEITQVAAETQSTLAVQSGCTFTSNSMDDGSFSVSNSSPGGQAITNLQIDLSTAMIPGLIFDPTGAGGDAMGKTFTANSGAVDVSLGVPAFSGPLGGGNTVLDIPFLSFDVGEAFTFSIDIDPNSIAGLGSSESSTAAIVTGAELAGATVTFSYDDGSVTSGQLIPETGCDGGSMVMISSCNDLGKPVPTSTVNAIASTVFNDDQYIGMTGDVGDEICVYVAETGLVDATGTPTAFESNNITAWNRVCSTIGAGGAVYIPFSLFGDVGDINRIAVSRSNTNGISPLSDLQILEKQAFPTGIGECTCINVGALASLGDAPYTAASGKEFGLDSDTYWTNGSGGHASYLPANAIANTTDDIVYEKDRHGFDMAFAFPGLPAGNYNVQLYFAETFHGVTGGNPTGGAGSRIMNVNIEGNNLLTDFDISDQIGATTAMIHTYAGITLSGDGIMNIDFSKNPAAPDVPAIQGICMIANNNATIFPVELLSFRAVPNGNYIDLSWSTASETNNDFFTVERSVDTRIFEAIGTQKGAGSSQSIRHYNMRDLNPFPTKSFYRLKQTDLDGTVAYSPIIEVNFEGTSSKINVFPNPASGNELFVELGGFAEAHHLDLKLRDQLGRTISAQRVELAFNGNLIVNMMPRKKPAPGMYILEVIDGLDVFQKRILIH